MTLAMPEFDGSGVVAACPPSAYTDEWVVVLELWDTTRRRIIWTVGTIGEDPTTGEDAFAPDESYDGLQEALEAFTATLMERHRHLRCPDCGGLGGGHSPVHVRHGNGGGSNRPCPSQERGA